MQEPASNRVDGRVVNLVNLLIIKVVETPLPSQNVPHDDEADKTKTTYSLGCIPKATDCSVYLATMTQGPSTWIYGGQWDHIAGVDQ